jgi:hypothetical protein
MKQYKIEMEGITPLLMHNDNLMFSEKIKAWSNDPQNKGLSTAGDDRSPAWTWIGCLYHDNREVGMPSDNLMTMLREGGAKVPKKGKETYKKHTQSGIALDQQQFRLLIDGKPINMDPIRALIHEADFNTHLDSAESLGFELLVKRAAIGRSKHVRVRPMFRNWKLEGSLTVLDEEMSGLTQPVLQRVFDYAGSLCGLGDWRPSSGSSGTFGKFVTTVTKM